MSLIGGGFNPFGGGLFNRGPNIVEKVDMLFKDVKTEGKKEGYAQAAKEYERAFLIIEKEYKETKELIANSKDSYNVRSEQLIVKLEDLEFQQKVLENEIKEKSRKVSLKYDIPIGKVTQAMAAGSLLGVRNSTTDILGFIYSVKELELKEARQKGYMEAKELYEEKIEKLQKELQKLKKEGNKDIQKYLEMINDLLDAISQKQMEIAELRVLL